MLINKIYDIVVCCGAIQGITIKPLVKYCKIIKDTDMEKELLIELHNLVNQQFSEASAFIVHHFAQLAYYYYCSTESLDCWAGLLCDC